MSNSRNEAPILRKLITSARQKPSVGLMAGVRLGRAASPERQGVYSRRERILKVHVRKVPLVEIIKAAVLSLSPFAP
jgi:hypothetical protein